MDAAHGLSIDGYDVNIQAEPGKSRAGHLHRGTRKASSSFAARDLRPAASLMIGEIEVTPEFR